MILILTPFYSPNIGGVESHLSDYTNYLIKKKIETRILAYQPITTKTSAPLKEKLETITIYRLPYPGFNLFYRLDHYPPIQFFYLFFGIFVYGFFYLLFNHKKIEVIHSHGMAGGLASGILGKLFKKRSVVSLHTIYKFSQKSGNIYFVKLIFNLNDKILAIADGCKKDLLNIGVNEKKITVYSYWVNTNKFKPIERKKSKEKINFSKKEFIALFVGRFNLEKQVIEALKSAVLAPEVNSLFIGHGPLTEEVEKYSKKYSNIKLIGRVNNNDTPFYYNSADILLLGSVDEDYFGKVSMEAMASGLPLLIADESSYFGVRKKVNSGLLPNSCGFMVPLNPITIANKLTELSRHPEKANKLRTNCRKFALKHFSPKNADKIYNLYNK